MYTTLHSPLPMSDECRKALRDLNVAFLNFVGMAAGVVGLIFGGAKFKIVKRGGTGDISAGVDDPASLIATILDLQNKQNEVDNACAGQGAGRRPYG
jgi:hypothetical protein